MSRNEYGNELAQSFRKRLRWTATLTTFVVGAIYWGDQGVGQSAEHVSTVVVGSGFGGSVTTYRLARAGQSVVLLERGRPYPPGSFPRTPADVSKNFWDPSEGLHGLFDVWSFRGTEAIVSSGLGGGSLIYANVLVRKDEKWFVREDPFDGGYETWPITRADVEPHYDAVEQMLGTQLYPLGAPGYGRSVKTEAMQAAADRLNLEWQLTPLGVTFANGDAPPVPGEPIPKPSFGNLHGRTRTTCVLCGECDVGCNTGSKNTLDHTYLSAAAHAKADIRTRCEVRSFAPRPGGGWRVRYVMHDAEHTSGPRDTKALPLREITADRLVLASGTLGTTYLLLRNRSVLPGISRLLGRRFSGNGDLLGFVFGAEYEGRGLGSTSAPVITSAMRSPDAVDGGTGRGFYVEDAGYPGFVDWLLEAGDLGQQSRRLLSFGFARLVARALRAPRSDIGAEIGRALGDGRLSGGATPLLGMGRDFPDGTMRLRSGYLDVDWSTRTSREYFDAVRQTMSDIAEVLDGRFVANPLSALHRVVTVHPLGGAPMGHGPQTGVVDQWGEVFGCPGLYVADGAAMPGPVGANPSLTIAAFADRLSTHLLETARRPARRTAVTAPAPTDQQTEVLA